MRKDRIAVAGQSAEVGLTASVVLMARDRKGPAVSFQMPLYPMLDCGSAAPSMMQITDHTAYIMVGQLDPFRDEDITYAQRLLQAGVPVDFHVVPGVTHGFENIFPDAEIIQKTRGLPVYSGDLFIFTLKYFLSSPLQSCASLHIL